MRVGTLLVLTSLLSVGCKKKPVDGPEDIVLPPVTAPTQAPPPPSTASAVDELANAFRRVNFATDSYTLDATATSALQSNAQVLLNHPEITIQVTGHCDERGTTDYNLALGQRRAEAVKRALVAAGVTTSRVQTLSLGEERPLSTGHEEVAWAENRRAEFVIVAR